MDVHGNEHTNATLKKTFEREVRKRLKYTCFHPQKQKERQIADA